MNKRILATLAVLALATLPMGFASAHHADDTPDANPCDTWTRPTGYSHDGANPNDQNLDDTTTPTFEHLYVMNGGNAQGYGPRYGVAGRDFYLEALGGGGFGAGGNQDPQHRSGEGGAVQGEVDVSNSVPGGGSVPNVSFSVNSFSLDDPLDNSHFVDTAQGACVEVAGNKVDPGEVYLETHHADVARNGCQVSNPATGSTPVTKTCSAWRTINILAAASGSWTVRTYKTTSCSDVSTNVYQTISGSGPTQIQDRGLGATAKRCVRMTLPSTSSGVLVVTG